MVRAMRRTLLPVVAAMALGLSVAACGGSDDDASRCTPVDAELAVGAEDSLHFDMDTYDTDAGCVEVTYTNDGSTAHNLLIEGVSDFKLNIGDVDTGTVELAPGNYEMYCDLAGHRAAGMVADLSVE
jgi:plastocyanin